MITIKLQINNQEILVCPKSCTIPKPGINETLQHQEQTASVVITNDDSDNILDYINDSIPATIYDDENVQFTGIINSDLSWTDNGNPYPIDNLTLQISDNTYKLKTKASEDYCHKNKTLSEIVGYIAAKTGLTVASDSCILDDTVPVITITTDTEYLNILNLLLFEYGYAFYFTEDGKIKVISINPGTTTATITESQIITPLNATRKKKQYSKISLKYGSLVVKQNEQIYFEGNDLNEDYTVTPITLRPGQYYPYESDPIVESREGQIYQTFQNGYAESYQLHSGEQRYRRSENTRLVFSENHHLINDWQGNITVDRTEFTATKASVRLINNGNEDAQLYQLAIRADAYYRAEAILERGTGSTVYEYESQYIYDSATADKLSGILDVYNIGGNLLYTFKTETYYPTGTCVKISLDTSGLEANFFILSSEFDPEKEIYTHKAISYGTINSITKRIKEEPNLMALSSNIVKTIETTQQAIVPPTITLNDLQVTAEKEGIRINYTISEPKYFSRLIVELTKDNINWQTINLEGNLYKFNRTTDGYPEGSTIRNWKIRAKIENIYGSTSSQWRESSINTDTYGTWLPAKPTVQRPVATKDGFEVNFALNSSNFGTSKYKVKVYYDDVLFFTSKEITENSYQYVFDRSTDGYPEKTSVTGIKDLSAYKVEVIHYNEAYGISDATASDKVTLNTDTYGTWRINNISSNSISYEVADRTVTLKMTVPSGSVAYYGDTKYKVSIKRIGISYAGDDHSTYPVITPDTNWYKPDLYSSPLTDEGNYKTDDVNGYEISSGRYSQTLPLAGQNTNNIVDTIYAFKITAYNESGATSNDYEMSVTALCTSIRDIVKSNVDYKIMYVEKLSAIVANVGLINQGGFGNFASWSNFWALSDIPAIDAGTDFDVIRGTFKVGDGDEYISVTPVKADGTPARSYSEFDHYAVEVKAGDISISNTGIDTFGTYIYQDSNKTRRLALTANGIIIQNKVGDIWINDGKFYEDRNNNLIISNTKNNEKTGIYVEDSVVYHFDDNKLDEDGGNEENITVNGTIESDNKAITGTNVLNGEIKKNLAGSLQDIYVLSKTNALVFDEVIINDEGIIDDSVQDLNNSASRDWGLTSEQVSARLFRY